MVVFVDAPPGRARNGPRVAMHTRSESGGLRGVGKSPGLSVGVQDGRAIRKHPLPPPSLRALARNGRPAVLGARSTRGYSRLSGVGERLGSDTDSASLDPLSGSPSPRPPRFSISISAHSGLRRCLRRLDEWTGKEDTGLRCDCWQKLFSARDALLLVCGQ